LASTKLVGEKLQITQRMGLKEQRRVKKVFSEKETKKKKKLNRKKLHFLSWGKRKMGRNGTQSGDREKRPKIRVSTGNGKLGSGCKTTLKRNIRVI